MNLLNVLCLDAGCWLLVVCCVELLFVVCWFERSEWRYKINRHDLRQALKGKAKGDSLGWHPGGGFLVWNARIGR